MIGRSSLLLALAVLGARAAHAQRLASDFRSLHAPPRVAPHLFPATPRPSYWLEGGLIGGIGLGLVSAYEANRWCECSGGERVKATVGVGLLAAGLGFTVGTLIGGQFPKHE
jgi:hypothetical protein